MQKSELKKGFTLIELLIVIGILAVLATVTLLVLNPAQMFAQARDSQRMSDLNTVKSAVSLYLSITSTPYLAPNSGADCATKFWGTEATSTTNNLFGTTHITDVTPTAPANTDGTGWVPVNFNSMSGGSPISSLPLDPSGVSGGLNTDPNHAYYYACSSTQQTFKLIGNLESTSYTNTGPNDKESTDGGIYSNLYETGTNLSAGL